MSAGAILTPGEQGPIPEACESWPWDGCPDCNRRPGELHSEMCGSLDRPDEGHQCRAWLDSNRCSKDAGHAGQHTNGLLLWGGTLRDRLGRAVTANEAANGSEYL